MHQGFRWTLGMGILLALGASEGKAQYYGGYGGYGWGGWGGGSTVQGDIARGLGYYNMGAGIYNEDTAVANSINAQTIMSWNQYMYLSQQEANRKEYMRLARRQQKNVEALNNISDRLHNNPEPRDIENGDALNAALDDLTDPKVHGSALRLVRNPVPGKAIRQIPFENASEAVTLSLDQLTGPKAWPDALQGEFFAPERKAVEDAIDAAVKEDEEGTLSPTTIDRVYDAASRLTAKLKANPPDDKVKLNQAQGYIKTLLGMARMLQKPEVGKVLAELDSVKETTLGSLLGFMHAYNLRFGPASNAEQRAVYVSLYPMLDEARDKMTKDLEPSKDGNTLARSNPKVPTDFFQGMKLEHLEPRSSRSVPPPPPPARP